MGNENKLQLSQHLQYANICNKSAISSMQKKSKHIISFISIYEYHFLASSV